MGTRFPLPSRFVHNRRRAAALTIRRERKDNFKVLPFAMQTDSPGRKPAKKKEAA